VDDCAEGIWESDSRKVKEAHPWRPRRSHYGELVQWDTSDHDWLEGRGEPVRYLVRMIDDATSRSWGRFVWHDGTRENMGVLWEYLERFGRAVDYYTDRDSMFAVPPRPGESREQQRQADRLTQIGRALRELGIGWIAAYSPQAKGRVERSFSTDQDRLIKELRLAKVKTMQAANDFLEKEYWPDWNERFAATEGQGRSAPSAAGGLRSGGRAESRRIAGDRQRLHICFCRQALPDCPGRSPERDEAPAPARGTAAQRRVESSLRRPLSGDQRVRTEAAGRAESAVPANRSAKTTMPAAKAGGWMASGTSPVRRCGKSLEMPNDQR
jgi:hypothetical protein